MASARAYINRAEVPPTSWETPVALFNRLDVVFGPFDMDAACERGQYTAETILGRGGSVRIPPEAALEEDEYRQMVFRDGLNTPWFGKVWCNPPYDKTLADWPTKAAYEVSNGYADLVVMLLPVRTGRPWWQEMEKTVQKIIYLPGRLKFVGAQSSAPFDSALAIWWRL